MRAAIRYSRKRKHGVVDDLRVVGLEGQHLPVPGFGLSRPALFAGALRSNEGLLLALEPSDLAELTAPK